MTDYVIIERGSEFPWTLANGAAECADKLAALRAEDCDRWAGAQIMTFDDWSDAHEARYLDTPTRAITAEEWDEMLGVLPPMQWHTAEGVNMFCMSEFTTGRITTQYGRMGDAYRSKSVRYGDRSTYLRPADFA